ncbi:MAG: hypothetical protein SFX18_09120 [Pirellulales bacterium]|nr:hypothetical protein [Pirellulales bacterium]
MNSLCRQFLAGISLFILATAFTAEKSYADISPTVVQKHLQSGDLAGGVAALQGVLLKDPQDDTARFGLGILQVLRGAEAWSQGLYKHGITMRHTGNIPFLRLPLPENPHPERLTYEKFREMLIDFQGALSQAEATLAGVQDQELQLPLRLLEARLDIDGDGQITYLNKEKTESNEQLNLILRRFVPGMEAENTIDFDYADVLWLRGYCHLLLGLSEIILAYDGQELFNVSAHLFFADPVTPYPFLEMQSNDGWFTDITDLIALVHMIRLPVSEPQRLKNTLAHWEQMCSLSRLMVGEIQQETDKRAEWIPGPNQKSWNGIEVSQVMLTDWLDFVTELEAILAGKKLLPFWRTSQKTAQKIQGVNFRKVFIEPRTLDVVLWIQGTAAAPYLEEGELVDPQLFNRLQQTFRGNFLGFAIWMN